MDETPKIRAFLRRAVVVAFALSALTPDTLDLTLALRAESTGLAAPAVESPTIPRDLRWSADTTTPLDDAWNDGFAPRGFEHESSDVCPLVWPELGLAYQVSKPPKSWDGAMNPASHLIMIGRRDGRPSLDPAPSLARSPGLYSVLCRLVC
ncbi:MAG: hypothetical protein P4L85_08735 [Paludisphaera borealis]|uniref:hypothetical protein n=1 Tax=Paludisphaera borealis TaxID=1387353 RepID=UPI00283C0A6F|nr:hypothetical protein [Paludisphaera borealis]MDR3619422.1 hypothetical protein [Paludisphaera borealis]